MKKILHIQVLPKLSGAQKISLEIMSNLPNDEYEKWILFANDGTVGDNKEMLQKAIAMVESGESKDVVDCAFKFSQQFSVQNNIKKMVDLYES